MADDASAVTVVDSAAFYDALSERWDDEIASRRAYLDAVDDLVVGWMTGRRVHSLLDIGCGDGRRTMELARRLGATSVGLDVSERMVQRAVARGLETYRFDLAEAGAATTPLADRRFELVTVLWNVLGHVREANGRVRLLARARDLLTPGGAIVLDVNNRHNAAAYGWPRALRNLGLELSPVGPGRDLVARRTSRDGGVATMTHLFSTGELTGLCAAAGLHVEAVRFVDYERGDPTAGRFSGQLCVLARPTAG